MVNIQTMIMMLRNSFRKGRGQMTSMLVIITAAAFLMNVGGLTLYNFSLSYDKKAEELNAPDVIALVGKEGYRPAYEDFLNSDLSVVQTTSEDIIFMPECSFMFGGGKLTQGVLFQNMDISREMSPLTIVSGEDAPARNAIYAPYIMQLGGGYAVGDSITLEYKHEEYTFQITGFVEDIMLGCINMGVMGFYLPEPLYKRFLSDVPVYPAVLLSAKLDDPRSGEAVSDGFSAYFNEDGNVYYAVPATLTKYARTISANITSMLMVAFSAIITLIALIVIRFRIGDSIRDDIRDIGSLKAIGYTSNQVKASMLLQYAGIALAGSLVGIGLSYLALPLLASLLSAQTGLLWHQGFAPGTSAVCLLLILAAASLNVLQSARRVKSLEPVTAIRGSLNARNVKKNFFRLDKSKGSLQFTLARKLIVQNPVQNIMISIIIAAVTYASAFGLVFFYNMTVDSDSFIGTIAGEVSSLMVKPLSNQNTARIREEIGNMPEVRKSIVFDGVMVLVNDEVFFVDVTEDFDDLEGQMLYEGSFPESPDEIAIGGAASEKFGKSTGETIRVVNGQKEADYLICGLIQSGNNIGRTLTLTVEGVRRVIPDYIPAAMYVYLNDGVETASFINALEDQYGGIIDKPINLEELIDAATGSYVALISLFAVCVLMVTGFVVSLVLYFVIKTMVARRKRDFGVQKALGFTSLQLVQQISLSFLPVVAIGSAAGVACGYLFINPMLSAMFKGVGIMKFELVISHAWLATLCVGIVLFSYLVAALVSSRVRKISAYALMTE
ncbi:MAG: FtsX-like permease family protein [Clostridiales bacterium]|nr:FtsX-like permease family protein [Clostridiales bacterium]